MLAGLPFIGAVTARVHPGYSRMKKALWSDMVYGRAVEKVDWRKGAVCPKPRSSSR